MFIDLKQMVYFNIFSHFQRKVLYAGRFRPASRLWITSLKPFSKRPINFNLFYASPTNFFILSPTYTLQLTANPMSVVDSWCQLQNRWGSVTANQISDIWRQSVTLLVIAVCMWRSCKYKKPWKHVCVTYFLPMGACRSGVPQITSVIPLQSFASIMPGFMI